MAHLDQVPLGLLFSDAPRFDYDNNYLSTQGNVFRGIAPRRAAALAGRFRFTAVRDVIVHETTDPEIAIIEYEVEGVREADGMRAAAPFAVVVRVQDGRIALWREYQNPVAMALVTAE